MKYSFLILCIAITVISCRRNDKCGCFESNGEVISESRNLESFNQLIIEDVFDIRLNLNSTPKIEIEAGKHLLKGIETRIENNVLIVKNKNTCNWSRKYLGKIKLNIFCDSLTNIKLRESCDLKSNDTIKVNKFTFDNYADISNIDMTFHCSELTFAVHAGTGHMNLKGIAAVCHLWTFGYCILDCSNLETDYCYITNNSTGNSYINVNKEIEAIIVNAGNIYYSGSPYKIISTETSRGRLIKLN